jgi:hypothetical protein
MRSIRCSLGTRAGQACGPNRYSTTYRLAAAALQAFRLCSSPLFVRRGRGQQPRARAAKRAPRRRRSVRRAHRHRGRLHREGASGPTASRCPSDERRLHHGRRSRTCPARPAGARAPRRSPRARAGERRPGRRRFCPGARRRRRSQLDALEQTEVLGGELGLGQVDEDLAQLTGQPRLSIGRRFVYPLGQRERKSTETRSEPCKRRSARKSATATVIAPWAFQPRTEKWSLAGCRGCGFRTGTPPRHQEGRGRAGSRFLIR